MKRMYQCCTHVCSQRFVTPRQQERISFGSSIQISAETARNNLSAVLPAATYRPVFLKSQKGIGKVMGAMGEMSIAAVQTLKDNLKIESPSRVFAALAEFIPEGVAVGIGKAAPVALNAVKTMGSAMSDKMLEYSKPLSEAFNMNTGFQKLRNVAINRMQNVEGMLLPMTAASGNQQTKTKLEIVDRSQNSYSLVLENGAELAHWLAPHMNRELGMLKG